MLQKFLLVYSRNVELVSKCYTNIVAATHFKANIDKKRDPGNKVIFKDYHETFQHPPLLLLACFRSLFFFFIFSPLVLVFSPQVFNVHLQVMYDQLVK